jgi:uroporphyrin-III C-methyltransferase/precorrin-2 dehydrogenase/sirohydrochlorin ferrochelatase
MGAVLAYGADEDDLLDARLAAFAAETRVPHNIVDNLEDSAFITPAIVDRDPVVVAIGTEGAAPVLARSIKADLEARLPSSLGVPDAGRPLLSPRGRAASVWRSGGSSGATTTTASGPQAMAKGARRRWRRRWRGSWRTT